MYSDKVTVFFDSSLKGIDYLVTGANKVDTHYTGFNVERDCGDVEYYDLAKIAEGGICPQCGKKTITISRGIEVGNIFQLGTKYSKAMNFTYTDENGGNTVSYHGMLWYWCRSYGSFNLRSKT